jgi:hypothetical protein
MSNSRKVTIFAASILSFLAVFGLGCKRTPPEESVNDAALKGAENALKVKVDNDPALRDIRPVLPVVLQAINEKCLNDATFCEDAVPFVRDIAPSTSTVSSPLKVRGGAMTFRSENLWTTDSSATPAPCTQLTPTSIQLKNVTAVPVTSPPTVEQIQLSLAGSWQIDLFGRKPDGTEGPNGIRIVAETNCGGKSGVSLTGESGPGQFYPFKDGQSDEDGVTFIKRYMDPTCSQSPQPSGDKDICEHISKIYINTSPTTTPKSNPAHVYHCLNGECVIGIGSS